MHIFKFKEKGKMTEVNEKYVKVILNVMNSLNYP